MKITDKKIDDDNEKDFIMIECNNLCKHNQEQCSYCREHYDVSTGEYRAKRKATNKYVYGYLVRDRVGDIRGILNKATDYKELAWIDEDTIEIW